MNTAAKEAHISALGNDATATKISSSTKSCKTKLKNAKMLRKEYEESVKATGENSKVKII